MATVVPSFSIASQSNQLHLLEGTIQVFTLDLKHEALYFPKLLGATTICRGPEMFEAVKPSIGLFSTAKVHVFPVYLPNDLE
jgi:hypothetical protein